MVLALEKQCQREVGSPYRDPLAKYLNKYVYKSLYHIIFILVLPCEFGLLGI